MHMIKLIGLQTVDTDIVASFTPEVNAYNIISGFMSDDCKPYRVALKVIIWFHDDGFVGELEAISPWVIDKSPCNYAEKISQMEGFPQFAIPSCDNEGAIQHLEDGYIVWLAKGKTIDEQINYKQVQFLLSGEELIAIAARHVSVVE